MNVSIKSLILEVLVDGVSRVLESFERNTGRFLINGELQTRA